jgi:beta-carotene 3-hydroxylase
MATSLVFATAVITSLIVATAMEAVAWATHRYVMHGILWVLHEDHHRPRRRGFQKNDLFAVFFAVWAIVFFAWGRVSGAWAPYSVGAGMTLYGLGYFLFHDVMFHHRVPWLRLKPWTHYLKRIVRAHADHHQSFAKGQARSFGFLYAPPCFDVRDG